MTFISSQDVETDVMLDVSSSKDINAECTLSSFDDVKHNMTFLTSQNVTTGFLNFKDVEPAVSAILSTNSEDKQQNGLEEKLTLSEDKTYHSVYPHVRHEQFFQRSNLNKQAQVGEKPLEWFLRNSDLTKHKRIHSGDKPFESDVCHEKFSIKFNFTKHKRVHSAEMPHECDDCHIKFSDSPTLNKHTKNNLEVKPFECHKRVHPGDKPHECDDCHKKFSDNSTLNKHKKIHLEVKPFEFVFLSEKVSGM
ncbi:zinc finger protein 679-like [Physella acuta]|uniref:zinc finger protein 679-like n=1 Tax=Physella acuta TaxID=109671 RepID=UPI0027DB3470|nr:zinc finger protein 679-like [Physella acuta]